MLILWGFRGFAQVDLLIQKVKLFFAYVLTKLKEYGIIGAKCDKRPKVLDALYLKQLLSRANRDSSLALSNKVAYTSEIKTKVLLPIRLLRCCFFRESLILLEIFQTYQQSLLVKLFCLVF